MWSVFFRRTRTQARSLGQICGWKRRGKKKKKKVKGFPPTPSRGCWQTRGGSPTFSQTGGPAESGRLTTVRGCSFAVYCSAHTPHEHQVAMSSSRATPRTSKHTSYKDLRYQDIHLPSPRNPPPHQMPATRKGDRALSRTTQGLPPVLLGTRQCNQV